MLEPDDNEPALNAEKYYGKYMGHVTENGPPDEGDHRGEVQVEIPGILEETADGGGSQAMQVTAKPAFAPGQFIVPDIEARVWIEFIAGDIDWPVWSAVWYPEDATPRTADDQVPTEAQKIIRTTSGHVIELDDTEDEEKIVVYHKAQSHLTIDKDGNITIEHAGGARVELKDDTTVEVSGDTLTLKGDITLDGDVHVTGATDIKKDLVVGEGSKTTISGNEITGG